MPLKTHLAAFAAFLAANPSQSFSPLPLSPSAMPLKVEHLTRRDRSDLVRLRVATPLPITSAAPPIDALVDLEGVVPSAMNYKAMRAPALKDFPTAGEVRSIIPREVSSLRVACCV